MQVCSASGTTNWQEDRVSFPPYRQWSAGLFCLYQRQQLTSMTTANYILSFSLLHQVLTIFHLLAFSSNSVALFLFPKPLISFIVIPSSSQSKCCLYMNLLGTQAAAYICPSRNRKAAHHSVKYSSVLCLYLHLKILSCGQIHILILENQNLFQ